MRTIINKFRSFLTLKHTIVLLILAANLVLFADFLSSFRISGTVAAAVMQAKYGEVVQDSYTTAQKELGYPFEALDFRSDIYSYSGGCAYDDNFGIVRCSSTLIRGHTPIVDKSYLETHSEQIKRLEHSLLRQNWTIATSSDSQTVSLSRLINPDNTLEWYAAGYHGYIDYQKNINGVICTLKMTRFDDMFGVLTCRKIVRPFWTRLAF